MIQGDVDTTYQTQQRDMFASGLAAQIGVNALGIWLAIKSHADFHTGEAWPGVRRLMELTGLASATVQKGLQTLQDAHLLRIARKSGQKHVYVARERMDVRVGPRVLCTIVIDYVPLLMRERLAKLKAASVGDLGAQDVWAHVEILPGPGMEWDANTRRLRGQVLADDVPATLSAAPSGDDARAKVRQLAESLRRRGGNDRISH